MCVCVCPTVCVVTGCIGSLVKVFVFPFFLFLFLILFSFPFFFFSVPCEINSISLLFLFFFLLFLFFILFWLQKPLLLRVIDPPHLFIFLKTENCVKIAFPIPFPALPPHLSILLYSIPCTQWFSHLPRLQHVACIPPYHLFVRCFDHNHGCSLSPLQIWRYQTLRAC